MTDAKTGALTELLAVRQGLLDMVDMVDAVFYWLKKMGAVGILPRPDGAASSINWQPMGTAPDDGTNVLLRWLDSGGQVVVCSGSWDDSVGYWCSPLDFDVVMNDGRPSHWAPLS